MCLCVSSHKHLHCRVKKTTYSLQFTAPSLATIGFCKVKPFARFTPSSYFIILCIPNMFTRECNLFLQTYQWLEYDVFVFQAWCCFYVCVFFCFEGSEAPIDVIYTADQGLMLEIWHAMCYLLNFANLWYVWIHAHIHLLCWHIQRYCASYAMYGLARTRNPSSQLITYPTRLCFTRLQDEEKVEQEPQEEEVHSAKEAGVEKWSLGQKETWTNCIEIHPPPTGWMVMDKHKQLYNYTLSSL